MDIGAHQAGFKTVCAIESDPHCAATLRRNSARKVVWQADVTPQRDQERIAFVPEGLWLSKAPDVPPNILRNLSRKDTTKYRRLHREGIAPTLRCGEALYHPVENRYITPREAARLQGFPDRHVFEGPIRRRTGRVPDLDQHRQVANAVPPPLARAVATQLREALCL